MSFFCYFPYKLNLLKESCATFSVAVLHITAVATTTALDLSS